MSDADKRNSAAIDCSPVAIFFSQNWIQELVPLFQGKKAAGNKV